MKAIFPSFAAAAACLLAAVWPVPGKSASITSQPLDRQSVDAHTVDVLPVRTGEGAQSLNGVWKFKYLPSIDAGADAKFYEPSFDASNWKTITVPGHWEMQGFAEPKYADELKEGTGLYRRVLRVPAQWKGQRVFLRFEGVLYGFRVYVNGTPVGEWASSFNPATFDITDALLPGDADNVLAVRVTTRSPGWNFDNMDSWSLSGIYRDVTLFALPALHFKDFTARTTLVADGTAHLHLDMEASGAGTVVGRLLAPGEHSAGSFSMELGEDGRGATDMVIAQPQLWTAETPSLYRLELDLQSGGRTVQQYTSRIGVRQVTIEDGVLKLNGRPIKLRGVDHHEMWPEGQVSTDENTRRDLELMRAANINFIRTSHYPPHPRLLEMCDEMGLYVDDEVPYIHGRDWLKRPEYQSVLFMRARATVTRDKNHPSVIYWSLGNENPITELGNNTAKYVKEIDPTRPVTFPTTNPRFVKEWQQFPSLMDIYAVHYPSTKQARAWAQMLQRPIVFTEYAHQRGVARSGSAVQDLWEIFYKSPRIAGGAIWVFQDQGILRTADSMESAKYGDMLVWLDKHRYFDTNGFAGMDGIVYSDRTPQVDYWQVRKVYSPVQIPERELPVRPGPQVLSFSVENRHDFRSLEGMKLSWSLLKNGVPVQNGVLPVGTKSKATETISVPVSLPESLSNDVFALALRCEDEKGLQFYERTLRLTNAADDTRWDAVLASLPVNEPTLDVSDALIQVRLPQLQLTLHRNTGRLDLRGPRGDVLVSGFGPNAGRHPTVNDMAKDKVRLPTLWHWNQMADVTDLQTEARRVPEGVEVVVRGNYPRPGQPQESLRGEYKLLVQKSGVIRVSYHYTPINATGEMLEAGLALAVPASYSEFRWLGQGPYAGYVGKDRLNEFGLFHLNREDLYFPGNRRGVDLAFLASPSGEGVLLHGRGMTVDVENEPNATIFSHLALVPGGTSDNDGSGDGVEVSSRIRANSVKPIEGAFELLPLGSPWPEPLGRWFGSPGERVEIRKPFFRSYDQ